jgi:hypothetical protein
MSAKDEKGDRFIFKPLKHGAFAVKRMDDDTDFPEGILMPKETVEEVLSALAD